MIVMNTLASFRLLRGLHRTAPATVYATTSGAFAAGVMHPLFPRLQSMYFVGSLLVLVIMVGSLVDMITIDASRVKHLPKFAWIIIVILIPLVGGIIWFAVGRDYPARTDRGSAADRRRWAKPDPTHRETPDLSVRDSEAELAAINREIAEHERAERIRRLESELEEKRREKGAEA